MASAEELDELVVKMDVHLTEYPESSSRGFRTFAELETFVNDEISFWGVHNIQGLDIQPLHTARNLLGQARQPSSPPDAAMNFLTQAVQTLQNGNGRGLIYSCTRDGKYLGSMAEINSTAARGALNFLRGPIDTNLLRDSAYLTGVIRALLYREPDLMAKGLAADVEAFQSLRAEISGFRNELATHTTAFETEIDAWKQRTQKEVGDWFTTSKKDAIDVDSTRSKDFKNAHGAWTKQITELEKLYEEKLALEGPVRYWRALEESYTKNGRAWVFWAVLVTAVFCLIIGALLYWPPELLKATQVAEGIRGAILAGVGISLAVYIVHLFVRMATSNYHLGRDARERRQLTLVFLALLKNQAVTEKDRQIVLAALFSRADTGLLKHDSGPAFPTSIGAALESLRGGRHS